MSTPTNLKLVATTVTALSALIELKDNPAVKDLRDSISSLIDELTSGLPVRTDGQPWSDEDIHAAAREARSWFQSVIDRAAK